MANIKLSASILSADFSKLGEQIRIAEDAGIDWIHIDVMDGHFVPNISMGQFVVETCRKITKLPLDIHLMIEKPERYVDEFAKAGANVISVHIENSPHIYNTLQHIRQKGCSPSIVVNPGTPASALSSVLPLVDMVLVMSVNPGYSGQEFISSALPKITQIREMLDQVNPKADIQVDGGVTAKTIGEVYKAGATIMVAATAIFKHADGIAGGIHALRHAVDQTKITA